MPAIISMKMIDLMAGDKKTGLTLLKEDQQLIIDLAYFEGFTQEEISKKLEIPLGTVKTRMRTAISVLKKILQP